MKADVAADVHTVPFRLSRNKVLVRARINGRYTTELVLDTGATSLAVGSEVRFGLDYGALLRAMTSPFVSRHFTRAAVAAEGRRVPAVAAAVSFRWR